jgi:hypothetical protein
MQGLRRYEQTLMMPYMQKATIAGDSNCMDSQFTEQRPILRYRPTPKSYFLIP